MDGEQHSESKNVKITSEINKKLRAGYSDRGIIDLLHCDYSSNKKIQIVATKTAQAFDRSQPPLGNLHGTPSPANACA